MVAYLESSLKLTVKGIKFRVRESKDSVFQHGDIGNFNYPSFVENTVPTLLLLSRIAGMKRRY